MSKDLKKLALIFFGGLIVFLAMLSVGCSSLTLAPTPVPPPPTATVVPPTVVPTPMPPTATPVPAPAFNFLKGATWTYEGVVKWDDKGKTQQKTMTWKIQVTDKIERADGIVGYVLKGNVHDLAFYAADKKPGDYLLLAKANRVYQITLIDTKPIERVKDKQDALADWMDDESVVYDFPLAANKKFGPAQFVAQGDKYVWTVAEAKPTKLAGIKGITPADATEYTLNYKSNPDWQNLYYVPNVGITRWVYHHNGTVSDVDVKLIEYNPTAPIAASPTGACTLVVSKDVNAYTRPSTQATVFGKLSANDKLPVSATTADGWLGFDPGVAQAANVGLFRLRWVSKSDPNIKLDGACDLLPVVAGLPPTACFQMFMGEAKIYTTANATSAVIVTAKAEDYAQVVAANDKWLHLDLNVGSLKQAKQGWLARTDANFNGACDKLPVAK